MTLPRRRDGSSPSKLLQKLKELSKDRHNAEVLAEASLSSLQRLVLTSKKWGQDDQTLVKVIMQGNSDEVWTWKSVVRDGKTPWFIFLYVGSFGMRGLEYSEGMEITECPEDLEGVHLKKFTKIMVVFK